MNFFFILCGLTMTMLLLVVIVIMWTKPAGGYGIIATMIVMLPLAIGVLSSIIYERFEDKKVKDTAKQLKEMKN